MTKSKSKRHKLVSESLCVTVIARCFAFLIRESHGGKCSGYLLSISRDAIQVEKWGHLARNRSNPTRAATDGPTWALA